MERERVSGSDESFEPLLKVQRRRLVETYAWEGSRWESPIRILICAYMRDSTSETHTHAHKEDQKQAVDGKQAVNCGTATHATRDGIAIRRPMRGKAHAGKKKSYAHSYVQYMCTCVRAYMRTFVRAYVRTCVRTYVRINARTHVCIWVRIWCFPTWAFPRKGLYESLRYRHASRYRGLPHVLTHVACTHVRMYAHMSTRMMFSQREPSHA